MGRAPTDVGLDCKEVADQTECFFCRRRLRGDVYVVELAPGMGPTGDLDQWRGPAGRSVRLIEATEARVAVGMEMALASREQRMGVNSAAIGRVEIEGRGRRGGAIGPFIANRRP